MQRDAFHFLPFQVFTPQPGTSTETALWGFAGMCDCNCFLMSFLSPLIEDHIVYYDLWLTHTNISKMQPQLSANELCSSRKNTHNKLISSELHDLFLQLDVSLLVFCQSAAVIRQPAFLYELRLRCLGMQV